jgi:hypothetical protein
MRAAEARPFLVRAKARLDRLEAYPKPVRLRGVRIVVSAAFFRLPAMRRYRGYCFFKTIVLRDEPVAGVHDDLITHELCHVWQGQHRRTHMIWTYARTPYKQNPYEREARWAVAETREGERPAASDAAAGR